MKFVMKEKWLSWGDDFEICDEQGDRAFYVDGKVFSLRDTYVMKDREGNDAAIIRKRLLAWGPTYEIERDGRTVAVVKKKLFTLFKCRFEVDVPGPDDLEATGNFLDHEYAFERGGREVAWVSKRWFSWTDSYGIEVGSEVDPVLVLASAVVIDACCHPDQQR